MRNTELLIPASSLEVLKTAVLYGADAVYIGGEMYGLRAKARNFSREDMEAGVKFAHENGVKVIMSNHDFFKTPSKEEIISRLCAMQEKGADIPKIAVMPQSKKDVLTLLSATNEMVEEHADRPIITMSMAATGVISRVCGEVFGSALTFGAVGKASAPGQMGAGELKEMLTTLHASL